MKCGGGAIPPARMEVIMDKKQTRKLTLQASLYSDDANFVCPNCDILMKYKHSGLYVCEKCGAEELNDFGKIKRYLDKHGPTNAIDLAANTGVRRSRIGEFLRLGKVEIPENSATFIHCKSCGTAIRFGNYCATCVHTKNIQGAFIGDTPKNAPEKMRFLDLE